MKKNIYKIISIFMLIPFFFINSVPVLADYSYDVYYVEPYSVIAYEYWNHVGFNLTQTFSNSTNIAVPAYYTETGNTNYTLICNEGSVPSGNGYGCYYRNNSTGQVYGTWNRYTNVAHTEVEQNISIQGAEIPWLHGTYIHDSSGFGTMDRAIYVLPHGDLYFSFITNTSTYNGSNYAATAVPANRHVKVYANETVTNYMDFEVIGLSQSYTAYQYTYKFHNNDDIRHWITIDIPRFNSDTTVIPLYIGAGDNVDDLTKQMLNITTDTENYLSNISGKIDSLLTLNNTQTQAAVATNNNLISGNPTSQTAEGNLSNSNSTLNTSVNQMNSIETEYNSDLNAALDDIDLSTDLVQHTGFTNAALWVSAQFNRLVVGTPLELVVTFSLITGLALVLIGKVRG